MRARVRVLHLAQGEEWLCPERELGEEHPADSERFLVARLHLDSLSVG